jgi:DNA-binding MarR family transcriptional regulator
MQNDGSPSSSLAVRLRQVEATIRERLDPVLGEHGLVMEDWRIVAVIDDHPGIGMSEAAGTAVVPAATLTRRMDRLVERGIVVRHIDAEDRRRLVVALSPRGRELAARLRELEQATPARMPADPSTLPVVGSPA